MDDGVVPLERRFQGLVVDDIATDVTHVPIGRDPRRQEVDDRHLAFSREPIDDETGLDGRILRCMRSCRMPRAHPRVRDVGFEVEQMIMAEVKGLHVPRWVANGEFAVQPYIVMEFIDGPTLLKMCSERVAPVDEIAQIGIEVAAALADLHQQHVLHLDLKPANIMFRPTREAVLIDFGLSRHEQLPDLLEEQFHRPTGTPDYMAPEQLFRVRSDKRSDIYAFGAILYQLATGQLPFGRPPRMRMVRRRVWRDPVPPRALRAEITPVLQEIILRCLEPLPDNRYGSATDLLFDLRHLDLVELTERAARTQQSDFRTTLRRRLRAPKAIRAILASATKPPPRPPIVLTVVDLRAGLEELRQTLLESSASVLANTPGARLACVHVMATSLMGIEENVDAAGENIHVQKLAELRAWAHPLQLPRDKVSYHLLEVPEHRGRHSRVRTFEPRRPYRHRRTGARGVAGQCLRPSHSRSTLHRDRRAGCR